MARGRDPGFAVIVKLSDQFTKPIDNINRKIAESTAKVRGMAQLPGRIAQASGLNKIGGAFGNLGKSMLNLRSSITGLIGPALRMTALMGGFELGKAIADATTLGGTLVKLSRNTSVSIEDLQRLQYAANQSGIDTETFIGALLKLNKTIRDARRGNKEAINVMQRAGVDMKALNNGTLTTVDVFNKFADAVHDSTDEVHKGAFAVGGFGRSGAEFIAFLDEGSAKIRETGTDAAVMTDKTARASKAFGDTMLKMSQHIKDLAYNVLDRLLPGMNSLAERTDAWMVANKPDIIKEVVSVVENLYGVAKRAYQLIRDDIIPALEKLTPAWKAFENIVGPGNAKLIAFTSVVAPGVIGALFGIGKAILGLGATLFANPIGAAILGVAVLVGFAAYKIWQNWDSIKEAFSEGVERAVTTTERLWTNLKEAPSQISSGFVSGMRELGDEFSAIWEGLPDDTRGFLGHVGNVISSMAGTISDAVVSVFNDPLGLVDAAWNLLPDGVRGFLGDVGNVISSMAGIFRDAIVTLFNLPLDLVNAVWDLLPEGVRGFLRRIAGAVTGMAGVLREAIVGALTGPIEFVKQKWNELVGWFSGVVGTIGGAFSKIPFIGGGGTPAPAVAGPSAPPTSMYGGGGGTRSANDIYGGTQGPPQLGGAYAHLAQQQPSKSEVTVNFENMPEGVRVAEGRSTGNTEVHLNATYAGQRAPAGAY